MNYETEWISCPICGADYCNMYIKGAKERYLGFGDRFDIVQCNRCRFIYTNPRPTKETIGYFYPDNAGYFQPGVIPEEYKGNLTKAILKYKYNYPLETKTSKFVATIFSMLYAHWFDCTHHPPYVHNGKLLDIGCSWGSYMKRMKDLGWEVYGIETNARSCAYAKDRLGLENVDNGFIDDIDLKKNYFDVVNMSMVLEHLHDVKKTLKKVITCLKQDGLFIFSVPDISGIEARFFKKYFYGLHVPQHLNHFSSKTIHNILSEAGFRILKTRHQNFDRDLVASFNYLDRPKTNRLLQNITFRNTAVKSFVFILSRLGLTSRMSIYAKKV